jgi:hypothetical protein
LPTRPARPKNRFWRRRRRSASSFRPTSVVIWRNGAIWVGSDKSFSGSSTIIPTPTTRTSLTKRNTSAKKAENYVVIVNEDGDEYICVDVNQPEGAIATWDFFAQELIDDCYYQPSSFVDYLINEFVSQAEETEEEVGEPIRWPASIDPSVDPYEDAD